MVKRILDRSDMTKEILQRMLAYDAAAGRFTWREKPLDECPSESEWKRWNSAHKGKTAGSVNGLGYRHIQLLGHHYLEHRLVWLYVHGSFPENEVDHINGDSQDNRVENLREVTGVQNCQNRKLPKHNTSGVIGVAPSRSKNKWVAHIKVGDENVYLGTYESLELAAAARRAAEKVAGYHPNHGRRSA